MLVTPSKVHPMRSPSAPLVALWTIVLLSLILEVICELENRPISSWGALDYAGIVFRLAAMCVFTFYSGLLQLIYGVFFTLVPILTVLGISGQNEQRGAWSTSDLAMLVIPSVIAYLLLVSPTVRKYRLALTEYHKSPTPDR